MPEQPRSLEGDLASLHGASFGWALACTGRDRDSAADVLQQAYWKVLSGRARYDGRSQLKTWLFGVIRLTALEQRRWAALRWLRGGHEPAEAASDEPSPSEDLAERETARLIGEALSELPPRQREILHLVFYEGIPLKEAAGIAGISLGSASQHYERGKRRLLESLTQRGVRLP